MANLNNYRRPWVPPPKGQSPYYGRRTGVNIATGKDIRKDSGGFDNFDDYFTEELDIPSSLTRRSIASVRGSNSDMETPVSHKRTSLVIAPGTNLSLRSESAKRVRLSTGTNVTPRKLFWDPDDLEIAEDISPLRLSIGDGLSSSEDELNRDKNVGATSKRTSRLATAVPDHGDDDVPNPQLPNYKPKTRQGHKSNKEKEKKTKNLNSPTKKSKGPSDKNVAPTSTPKSKIPVLINSTTKAKSSRQENVIDTRKTTPMKLRNIQESPDKNKSPNKNDSTFDRLRDRSLNRNVPKTKKIKVTLHKVRLRKNEVEGVADDEPRRTRAGVAKAAKDKDESEVEEDADQDDRADIAQNTMVRSLRKRNITHEPSPPDSSPPPSPCNSPNPVNKNTTVSPGTKKKRENMKRNREVEDVAADDDVLSAVSPKSTPKAVTAKDLRSRSQRRQSPAATQTKTLTAKKLKKKMKAKKKKKILMMLGMMKKKKKVVGNKSVAVPTPKRPPVFLGMTTAPTADESEDNVPLKSPEKSPEKRKSRDPVASTSKSPRRPPVVLEDKVDDAESDTDHDEPRPTRRLRSRSLQPRPSPKKGKIVGSSTATAKKKDKLPAVEEERGGTRKTRNLEADAPLVIVPRSPKIVPRSPKAVPRSPKAVPQSPKVVPRSPKVVPRSPKVAPQSPKVVPRSPKVVPQSPKVVPQSPKVVPRSPKRSYEKRSGPSERASTSKTRENVQETDDGVRRSNRVRVPRLAYWCNQRIQYKPDPVTGTRGVVGIVNPDEAPPKPRKVYARKEKKTHNKRFIESADDDDDGDTSVQLEGYDNENLQTLIPVINPESGETVSVDCFAPIKSCVFYGKNRKIATNNDPLTLTKAITQPAFAQGVMKIMPYQEKTMSRTSDDTLVYYISTGVLEVTIHETTAVLKKRDSFFVPRGNTYCLRNPMDKKAELCFFQLRG